MTHTHANLDVSRACYYEVRKLLAAAGYEHAFNSYRGMEPEVIDMHGIVLRIDPDAGLVRACTVQDLCCRSRQPENIHILKHCVCERCGWNGKQTELVGEIGNCPECNASWEVTEQRGYLEQLPREQEAERILDEILDEIEVEPRQITEFDSPLLVKIAEADAPTANGRVYTEEALRQLDGKTVPVTKGIGGPVIGEAKLDGEGNAVIHTWMEEPLKPMGNVTMMQMRMHEGEVPRACKLDAATGGPGTSDNCCFQPPGHEGLHDWEKPTEGYTEIFAPAELLAGVQLCGDACGSACITRTPEEEAARQLRLGNQRVCPDGSVCKMDCVPRLCVRQMVTTCPECNAAGDEPCKTWRGLAFLDGTRHSSRDRLQSWEPEAVSGAVDQPEEVRMSSVKIGAAVVFADEHGTLLNAQCISVFATKVEGPDEETTWKDGEIGPTINVAFADPDATKTDSYGRQFRRETSVPHKSGSTAHGYWWVLPEDL